MSLPVAVKQECFPQAPGEMMLSQGGEKQNSRLSSGHLNYVTLQFLSLYSGYSDIVNLPTIPVLMRLWKLMPVNIFYVARNTKLLKVQSSFGILLCFLFSLCRKYKNKL